MTSLPIPPYPSLLNHQRDNCIETAPFNAFFVFWAASPFVRPSAAVRAHSSAQRTAPPARTATINGTRFVDSKVQFAFFTALPRSLGQMRVRAASALSLSLSFCRPISVVSPVMRHTACPRARAHSVMKFCNLQLFFRQMTPAWDLSFLSSPSECISDRGFQDSKDDNSDRTNRYCGEFHRLRRGIRVRVRRRSDLPSATVSQSRTDTKQ